MDYCDDADDDDENENSEEWCDATDGRGLPADVDSLIHDTMMLRVWSSRVRYRDFRRLFVMLHARALSAPHNILFVPSSFDILHPLTFFPQSNSLAHISFLVPSKPQSPLPPPYRRVSRPGPEFTTETPLAPHHITRLRPDQHKKTHDHAPPPLSQRAALRARTTRSHRDVGRMGLELAWVPAGGEGGGGECETYHYVCLCALRVRCVLRGLWAVIAW